MRRGTGWFNFLSYQGAATTGLDYLKEQIGDIEEAEKSSIHEHRGESDVSTLHGSDCDTMQQFVRGLLTRVQRDDKAQAELKGYEGPKPILASEAYQFQSGTLEDKQRELEKEPTESERSV